jgi:hypothetical protein
VKYLLHVHVFSGRDHAVELMFMRLSREVCISSAAIDATLKLLLEDGGATLRRMLVECENGHTRARFVFFLHDLLAKRAPIERHLYLRNRPVAHQQGQHPPQQQQQ